MNTLPYSIVVDKNITKFEQLKGKSAAISRFGTTSDLAMRYALEKNELVPNRDVTIIQLGDKTTRFAALTKGTVQATVISPPFDITAKNLGYRILADMADLGLPYQHASIAISNSEILDETYRAYRKLTEKKPYPTLKGLEFQIEDVAKKVPKAKGMKQEEFTRIAILKELDQSGFIDDLYKK